MSYAGVPVDFSQHVHSALARLEAASLLRHPRVVTSDQGPEITLDGRRVVSLCSNNYLGLANHPALAGAAAAALDQAGYGSAASRHISGTHALHRQAEDALAAYVRQPAASLFSSGYAANVGTVQALVGRGDLIFSDALNHASLIDGCVLSRAKVHVYRHRDLEHLERLIAAHRGSGNAALVITDAGFSMDGDLAPVAELRALCDAHGMGLLVDEAHTLGILGPSGRGRCAELGVLPDVLIGTLGKSFGAAGAFAATGVTTNALIQNRARSYVFSTAPSPSTAAAALAGLRLVEAGDERRATLTANVRRLRDGLAALGLPALPGPLPILPVPVGDPAATMAISAALLDAGCFVHGIRPPTVPDGQSRLRVTATAGHGPEHLQRALAAFATVRHMFHV